jgi:hypothetical protein
MSIDLYITIDLSYTIIPTKIYIGKKTNSRNFKMFCQNNNKICQGKKNTSTELKNEPIFMLLRSVIKTIFEKRIFFFFAFSGCFITRSIMRHKTKK